MAQGVGECIQGTNTIEFFYFHEMPKGKKPTYVKFVCTYRPQKKEKNRTQMTIGGNLINYPGSVRVNTAQLPIVKMLLDGTISTPGARFLTADIGNFYLGTNLPCEEYAKIAITNVPQEIIDEHDLLKKST